MLNRLVWYVLLLRCKCKERGTIVSTATAGIVAGYNKLDVHMEPAAQ
jgi:hypothetical protein